VTTAQALSVAARNEVLLRVCQAYLDLLRGDARRAVAAKNRDEAAELARLTAVYTQRGQGRPIETLDSFNQLLTARQELVRALTEFNAAQFRLYAAVGSSPPAVPVVGAGAAPPMPPPKK
jgi:outer membrane protein TolC